MTKHRSRFEIWYSILAAAATEESKHNSGKGTGRTKLMYLAELNANQAKTYFPMLEDNGLLKVRINNFPSFDSLITRWYSITQKGYRFLEMWQMLEKDNAIIARRRARD